MPNIDNEMVYEILKIIQEDVSLTKTSIRDMQDRLTSLESSLVANTKRLDMIDRKFDRSDDRMYKAESVLRRNELAEPPTKPYDPNK